MKIVNKKFLVSLVAILILSVGLITLISLNSSSTIMTLKSEYSNFNEKDGIITEVTFHAPTNFNVIQLDSKSEISYDKNGKEQQIITYTGIVKKSFFESEPTIQIDNSKVYKFVFTDKTVTITNGTVSNLSQSEE